MIDGAFTVRRGRTVAQGGLKAATQFVEARGAGPGPNAVRPYDMRKCLLKKQEITALQCSGYRDAWRLHGHDGRKE